MNNHASRTLSIMAWVSRQGNKAAINRDLIRCMASLVSATLKLGNLVEATDMLVKASEIGSIPENVCIQLSEVGNTEARLKKDLAALLACGWNPALGNPRTAVPLGSAPAVDAPKRRFGEEEAYLDALCPEGARGLLGPLLGLAPPKKAKVGRAKPRGVTDATNAQGA